MSIKNKSINDWVVITYCDYNGVKTVFRKSYSVSAANNWFEKNYGRFKCRVWQENKKGKIINDSKNKTKLKKETNCEVTTYCDYGNEKEKRVIRRSNSLETAKRWFLEKSKSFTNRGRWKVWQEDKKGNIINESCKTI